MSRTPLTKDCFRTAAEKAHHATRHPAIGAEGSLEGKCVIGQFCHLRFRPASCGSFPGDIAAMTELIRTLDKKVAYQVKESIKSSHIAVCQRRRPYNVVCLRPSSWKNPLLHRRSDMGACRGLIGRRQPASSNPQMHITKAACAIIGKRHLAVESENTSGSAEFSTRRFQVRNAPSSPKLLASPVASPR